MKQVYKRIVIEGFGSICKLVSLDLDRVGINLVKGSNGKGKSTVFDALLWCEYGKTSRDTLSSWGEVQTESYRGTRVIIDRTDGTFDYRVARHHNFTGTTCKMKGGSKLMIFKKSVTVERFDKTHLVGTALHKKDMQELIEYQLGAEYKAFTNSIIMPQRAGGLIDMPNVEKRKMFDKLFSLHFIETARDTGKSKLGEVVESLRTLGESEKLASVKLKGLKELVESEKRGQDRFEEGKTKRLDTCKGDTQLHITSINKMQLSIIDLEKYVSSYTAPKDLRTEVDTLYKQCTKAKDAVADAKADVGNRKKFIDTIKEGIQKSNSRLETLEKDLSDVSESCPYCDRALLKNKVKKIKQTIQKSIEKELEVAAHQAARLEMLEQVMTLGDLVQVEVVAIGKLLRLQQRYNILSERLESADTTTADYQTAKAELKYTKANLADTFKSLEIVSATYKDIEKERYDIVDMSDKLREIESITILKSVTITQVQALTKRRDYLNWWLKKGLGSSGVRAYIFNAMLEKLNGYVKKYADRLGLGVVFSVDLTKPSTPFVTTVYKGLLAKPYSDFSGGQKQRVGLCLWFAMHDLISEQCGTNLFIMDEGFEGLDNEGIEAIFDLIRVKARDKSVFVITHSDMIDSLNCKNIYISADVEGSTVIKS